MNVITLEEEAFYALIQQVLDKINATRPLSEDKWISTEEAMRKLRITSKTTLSELIHWTGHAKQLNRPLDNKIGDVDYAKEELIAELGAAFLTAEFGIVQPEKADHAAYIENWLAVLKNNKEFIVSASKNASRAVQFLKEIQPLKLP